MFIVKTKETIFYMKSQKDSKKCCSKAGLQPAPGKAFDIMVLFDGVGNTLKERLLIFSGKKGLGRSSHGPTGTFRYSSKPM